MQNKHGKPEVTVNQGPLNSGSVFKYLDIYRHTEYLNKIRYSPPLGEANGVLEPP